MKHVNMSDHKENPIFKAIEIQCRWESILSVSSVSRHKFCKFTLIQLPSYTCTQFLVEDGEWGKKLQHSVDDDLNTPLHVAASCGNVEAVTFFFKKDSQAYTTNNDGELPIHLAAKYGHYM